VEELVLFRVFGGWRMRRWDRDQVDGDFHEELGPGNGGNAAGQAGCGPAARGAERLGAELARRRRRDQEPKAL
jgi:hypothetical protein